MGLFTHTWSCLPTRGAVYPHVELFTHTWSCLPTHGAVYPHVSCLPIRELFTHKMVLFSHTMVLFTHTWICLPTRGAVYPDVGYLTKSGAVYPHVGCLPIQWYCLSTRGLFTHMWGRLPICECRWPVCEALRLHARAMAPMRRAVGLMRGPLAPCEGLGLVQCHLAPCIHVPFASCESRWTHHLTRQKVTP